MTVTAGSGGSLDEKELADPILEANSYRMDTAKDRTMRIIFYRVDKKTGVEIPLGVLPMDSTECYEFCQKGLQCYDRIEGIK